jgi:AcrR family transcriptional regulator
MATRPPSPRAERADAARNRERILQAAERLFAERGVETVSMDAIAEAAGVGKATLFRRFGDRAGLALALLDAKERDLQGLMLRGDPPLGPGAPAEERLVAFLDALIDLLEAHTDLVVASETAPPGARYRSGLYATYHMHVRVLIAEARGADADADALAELLLAPLAGEHYRHLRRERGMPVERIKAATADLARGLLRA